MREQAAARRNQQPLPRVPARPGVILPARALTSGLAQNYTVTVPTPAVVAAPAAAAGAATVGSGVSADS